MARKPIRIACAYVVDTSYICELLEVPGHHSPQGNKEVRQRFETAVNDKDHFLLIPLPCILETGNRIGHIGDGIKRRDRAEKLLRFVEEGTRESGTWVITPPQTGPDLLQLCTSFHKKYQMSEIGLTDAFVVETALRKKEERRKHPAYKVHIWTTDEKLKRHEPDKEDDAFTKP